MALVRPEDKLDGASNFITWKARVMNILEEYDLDSYVTSIVEEPSTNAKRVAFKRNQEAKKIIFDSVKNHLMPVIISLKTAKE